MKKQLIALLFAVLPVASFAAGGSGYPLEHFEPNVADQASLQDGLKTYMNYCMGCHATKFQRYERVADDLGVPHDLFNENIIFNGAKIGSLMENSMRAEESKRWFGATPPDLTLVARVRGADWLYTYLRTFYVDPKRPWGVNNKVFPDVGMPHVLAELQGLQVDNCAGQDASERDTLTGEKLCGFELVKTGSMNPAEYDQAVYNLVNFLVYSAEPMQLERERIGYWVLLFLLVLLIPAYLLKKEYWKDVH
ncbi:cytochrome c1 [Aestuariirhabdus sp. Z084]|uniref:cytochrome c1 n=1 Tax=Aestuariirhabdus haliotis TaxID=2918751 RepID=UPI00201B3BCB|nr:cytochrome c1 [Aestuariirhabdus haliotis]MCL6415928.1 cytochrome c1 [Aestuariirhabdus haliotis]MCL6419926.1 cytochrome c1 [Aestuariirhabdus haliotis]